MCGCASYCAQNTHGAPHAPMCKRTAKARAQQQRLACMPEANALKQRHMQALASSCKRMTDLGRGHAGEGEHPDLLGDEGPVLGGPLGLQRAAGSCLVVRSGWSVCLLSWLKTAEF